MKLGILAGYGKLPQIVAQKAAALNYELCIAALDQNNLENFHPYNCQSFSIGQVGKIIDFFKTNQVRQLVLAGKVDRPNWQYLKPDALGAILLAKIMKNKLFGDDTLMQTIDVFLKEQGFEVVSFLDILSYGNQVEYVTKAKPYEQDLLDVELALEVAQVIGRFDIGQSVVIERGCVIGVEGQEGTDALLVRCAQLIKFQKPSGVLVKLAKPCQSLRLDPPAFGSNTIQAIHDCGLRGIAYEHNKIALIDIHDTFALADKLGIFIYPIC